MQLCSSRMKKKTPSSKGEKIMEDGKNLPIASPGTKGTLDGYLVRTPDVKSPPSARQHKNASRAKKNLRLVADRDTDFPGDPASPSRSTQPRDIQAEVEDQRWVRTEAKFEESDGRIGSNDLCAGDAKRKPLSEETGSTELRRFAAGFLSLYCG